MANGAILYFSSLTKQLPRETFEFRGSPSLQSMGISHQLNSLSQSRDLNMQKQTSRITAIRSKQEPLRKSTSLKQYEDVYEKESRTLNIHKEVMAATVQSKLLNNPKEMLASTVMESSHIHPLNRRQVARRARLTPGCVGIGTREFTVMKPTTRPLPNEPMVWRNKPHEVQLLVTPSTLSHTAVDKLKGTPHSELIRSPEVTRSKVYVPKPGIAPYFRFTPSHLSRMPTRVDETQSANLPKIPTIKVYIKKQPALSASLLAQEFDGPAKRWPSGSIDSGVPSLSSCSIKMAPSGTSSPMKLPPISKDTKIVVNDSDSESRVESVIDNKRVIITQSKS